MSKGKLRKAYKKLAQMFVEDQERVEELESSVYARNDFQGEFDEEIGYDDFFDEDYVDDDLDSKEPEELVDSRQTVEIILDAARSKFIDHSDQIRYAIEAIVAQRDQVIVSSSIVRKVLSLFPEDKPSKLDNIMYDEIILDGAMEDIDKEMLARLFLGVGQTIDDLPVPMLTDSLFMEAYLTSKAESDPNFANRRFIDYTKLNYGEIVDRAKKICSEEKEI